LSFEPPERRIALIVSSKTIRKIRKDPRKPISNQLHQLVMVECQAIRRENAAGEIEIIFDDSEE